MTNIKAILFDLDGTLRHHLPNGGDVFAEYLRNQNLNFSEGDRIRAEHWEHFYFANSPEIQEDNETFKSDFNAFWINFSKRRLMAFGIPESQAAEMAPTISKHMGENYKPQVIVPEEIPSVLTSLREGGYVLGVVSNRESPFQNELKEMNIDSYFNFSLAAGEVGFFKPDAPIFERAIEMAGVSASEAMYVGDNYFADVLGSTNAGLVSVLYDPTGLFSEAECTVIKSFNELHGLLK